VTSITKELSELLRSRYQNQMSLLAQPGIWGSLPRGNHSLGTLSIDVIKYTHTSYEEQQRLSLVDSWELCEVGADCDKHTLKLTLVFYIDSGISFLHDDCNIVL